MKQHQQTPNATRPVAATSALRGARAVAIAIGFSMALGACSMMRGQQDASSYVDDTAISSKVKAAMIKDKAVDGTSISVETMQGTVLLTGFAKSADEKAAAERAAKSVSGVKSVRNQIVVKP